jgi:hypothetical protein
MRAALVGLAAAVVARVVAACVIWDPPADEPPPIHYHPLIQADAVVPPSTVVLTELPGAFTVPLEIVDPTASFVYEVFIDFDSFDPLRQTPVILPNQRIDPTTNVPDGGIIDVQFSLVDLQTSVFDPSACHVIQFVVALAFSQQSDHTPDSNGADEIEWRYAPPGAGGGCLTFDAGDGAFPGDADGAIVVPITD